ncbi:hypothetical protein [Kistimonas asteriae]|uniref:hypothetical protein n=1 Tax=Kistimonas asteriae TaxID=517724 RepID=UPI001BAC0B64|nr:hypothetical protein [Kistimonas asteriae]
MEFDSPVEVDLFSHKIFKKVIEMYLVENRGQITGAFAESLGDFNVRLGIITDPIAHSINSKLRGFRANHVPIGDYGAEYKKALEKAVKMVKSASCSMYDKDTVLKPLGRLADSVRKLPKEFFSVVLQQTEESRNPLPDESSWIVDPILVAKYPEKYPLQNLGIQIGDWGFSFAIVALGAYQPESRGACAMDQGDASDMLSRLISVAENRHNMSRADAVSRIMSDPAFVTELGFGSEPKFEGQILGVFDATSAVFMSALAVAHRLHLAQYAGMLSVMGTVKAKRFFCALPKRLCDLPTKYCGACCQCGNTLRAQSGAPVSSKAQVRTPVPAAKPLLAVPSHEAAGSSSSGPSTVVTTSV